MKKLEAYHVDAFTDQVFGGNAAGVVPEADGLSDIQMRKIAREFNLSETAFLFKAEDDSYDYKIKYFTPTDEVDFCGHATVGAAWVMAVEHGWVEKSDRIRLKTNVGIVPVEWNMKDGKLDSVMMTQISPKVKSFDLDKERLCKSLGISVEDLDENYPISLGHTGNWHLLVPIKNSEIIDGARPNLDELKALNLELGAITTHLFTFNSFNNKFKIYTRDFAPAIGLPEDPVTGAANGALAGYLMLEKILDDNSDHEFLVGQGHAIDRPGELTIKILANDGNPIIKVGGKGVISINGNINL